MPINQYFLTIYTLVIGLTYLAQPVGIALSAPRNSRATQTPFQIQTQMAKFVVRIDGDGDGNNGTGFIIKKDGLTYTVLTNEHVVHKSIRQKLTTSDNKQHFFTPKSIKILPGVDLAEITFFSSNNYDTAKLSKSNDIQLGKSVYTYGWPAIDIPMIPVRKAYFLSGIIKKTLPTDNNFEGYSIEFELAAIRGISGSPVCDENGEVIGIYGWGSKNMTRAVPISTYQQYANIDRARLPSKANNRKEGTILRSNQLDNINFNLAYSFNGIDVLPMFQDGQTFESSMKNATENNERLFGSSSSVAILPNGQTFVTGDSEGNLELRQLQDGQVYQNLNSDKLHKIVRLIAISPDGEILISVNTSNILIQRLKDGKILHYLRAKLKLIKSIAISPDGETFMVAGLDDKKVIVLGLKNGKLLHTFNNGHLNWLTTLLISPDGETFITGSLDNTIKVWRLKDGELLHNLILDGNRRNSSSFQINALAISPDGKILISGGKAIKVWSLEDGKLLQTLKNYEDTQGRIQRMWEGK
jgi:Trypsin-like peptidase domain/WD domain, G-beta repeat